jgi:hypothetical protein
MRAKEDDMQEDDNDLVELSLSAWEQNRMRDSDTVTHPCDRHPSALCMCKGACSCHFDD